MIRGAGVIRESDAERAERSLGVKSDFQIRLSTKTFPLGIE
ncbi:hypothetical protein [Nostoc sp. LEGE 12447]|nr:hypothetical protein [Nostoc sp. LEGE 12447]